MAVKTDLLVQEVFETSHVSRMPPANKFYQDAAYRVGVELSHWHLENTDRKKIPEIFGKLKLKGIIRQKFYARLGNSRFFASILNFLTSFKKLAK